MVRGGGGALDTRLGFRIGNLGFRFEGEALGCLVDLEGTDWAAGGGGALDARPSLIPTQWGNGSKNGPGTTS